MQVFRVQGQVREVPREQELLQWVHALFAYVELHNNPSLEVIPELEGLKTVPASRWRRHRLLLDAQAALVCRFPKEALQRLKERTVSMIQTGASYQSVETGLGKYQRLDADQLVEHCPFLVGDAALNTYWDGWGADSDGLRDLAHTISVRLARLRECSRSAGHEPRVCVMVAAHALLEHQHAGQESSGATTELCYSFWIQPLSTEDERGLLVMEPKLLLDALPLSGGRAAWAVGLRVLDGAVMNEDEALHALQAAVELVAALTPGRSLACEQPWQLPIMSAAQLAHESVAAMLEAFAILGTICRPDAWSALSPPCVFDSKYLHAAGSAGAPRTLTLLMGRYEATLEVALDRESACGSDSGQSDRDGPAGRWSMLRLRDPRGQRNTGGIE